MGSDNDQGNTDMKFYRYILQDDNGMAPCADDELITLATCKPRIRKGCQPGDWVAGFMPRPNDRGLIIWAGRVQEVVDWGEYERRFRGRQDAVYRQLPDGSFIALRPDYHCGGKDRDLSGPILVFDNEASWYFGKEPRELPEKLYHLAAAGRGERVNGVADGDIQAFESWLRELGKPGVYAAPRG